MASAVTELSQLTLFESCSPRDLERLSAAVTGTREILEGSALCREGEIADRWWIVVEGTAEVTIGGLYVATIGPGESIGELALLDGENRNATVTASSDMVVQEVDGTRFLELLTETPDVTLALLRELAVRLRVTNQLTVRPVPGEREPEEAAIPRRPTARGAGAVTFNPFAPGYFANPYRQYAELRQHDPVHLDQLTGAYLLTRYEDVHRLIRDRTLTVGIDHAAPTPVLDAERARDVAGGGVVHRMMLRRDGEDHARLRRLLMRTFTPKAIAAWRERTELVVDRLLTDIEERESIDVVDQFAAVFPDRIISEMLGMPEGDTGQFRRWSEALTKTIDPLNSPHEESASIEASRAMVGQHRGSHRNQTGLPGRRHPHPPHPGRGIGGAIESRRGGRPGDPLLRRGPRECPQPCRQRSGPPVRVPRSARSSAGQSLPRLQRDRGVHPLRFAGSVLTPHRGGTDRGRRCRDRPGFGPSSRPRRGQSRSREVGAFCGRSESGTPTRQ